MRKYKDIINVVVFVLLAISILVSAKHDNEYLAGFFSAGFLFYAAEVMYGGDSDE